MSKTGKMKNYEVMVYRPGSTEWKAVTIEAECFTVKDDIVRFWIGTLLVASFPKEGWGSVIEK